MKDLGQLHHFLGVTIETRRSGLFLHQRQYALDILEQAGMTDCKPCCLLIWVISWLILLPTGALPVPCSTSPSPSRISPMPFSRSVFTCMIPGSLILLH